MYSLIHEKEELHKRFEACYRDNLHSIWAGQELYRPGNSKKEFLFFTIQHFSFSFYYVARRILHYESESFIRAVCPASHQNSFLKFYTFLHPTGSIGTLFSLIMHRLSGGLHLKFPESLLRYNIFFLTYKKPSFFFHTYRKEKDPSI